MTTNWRQLGASARAILDGCALTALDVGARGDIPRTWLPLDGVAQIVSVEPDPDECVRIRTTYDRRGNGHMYTILQTAMGRANESRTLRLTNYRGGSSLFNPDNAMDRAYSDHDYLFPITTVSIDVRQADEVLAEADIRRIDLAKLDVQGAELEILAAIDASRLSSVVCIELEACLHRKSPDYPTFVEVQQFMAPRGLELFDVRVSRRHRVGTARRTDYVVDQLHAHPASPSVSGRVYEFDMLYFRPCEALIKERKSDELRRLICCFCLYGFFAEALHAANAAARAGLFEPRAAAAIADSVKDWHKRGRFRTRWKNGRFWDLVRWPLKYMDVVEQPNWWPYR
jgi:FkbM family methyltransferase